MLYLPACQAWSLLIEDESVARIDAAVTAIGPQKIAIFGGQDGRKLLNTGYILDLATEQVNPILGKEADPAFLAVT